MTISHPSLIKASPELYLQHYSVRPKPRVDALVWERRDSAVTEVFTGQTGGSHFLDCHVITLSPSSVKASSSKGCLETRAGNFSKENTKTRMSAEWLFKAAFQRRQTQ